MNATSNEQGRFDNEQGRFEPTVFSAVRRYWTMVLAIALLFAAAAVGYTLVVPEVYRADATVTVPPTSTSQGENSDQYLDSQVLLLQSQEVADGAARITNAAFNKDIVSPHDFSVDGKALKITPPEGTSPGSYGSSIVALSFTWPDAKVAQTGANAVLQAFDGARVAAITAQGKATVAGIDKAISDARTRNQRKDLINQRSQALVNQQVDLSRHPTVVAAIEPRQPINGNSKRSGAIGLLVGLTVGAALAYARAMRRQDIGGKHEPATIYGAPLISEIPTQRRPQRSSARDATSGLLPVVTDPESATAESYRFVAASLERMRLTRGNQLVVAFVATTAGASKSAVVANVALAVAEGGTSVLAVDADPSAGSLTHILLPSSPAADGFEQVLAGTRFLSDCTEPSPLNGRLTVLNSGHATTGRTTGAAYSKSVEEVIGKAKASFDFVLIDSPALLQVADATELVANSDVAAVVISAGELVRDHSDLAKRLDLVESEVVGYIYWPLRKTAGAVGGRAELPVVPSW